MYKDCHVHTTISHDGKSPINDYINKARCYGVDEITFTEHYDIYRQPTSNHTLDLNAYYNEYLKHQINSNILINFGIEVSLQPDLTSFIERELSKYPFDFIIGSSHITCKKDIASDPTFFEGLTSLEAYHKYFYEMLENIKNYTNYDVYGHLDYVIRYGGYNIKKLEYKEYQEILDEILKALIRHDKGIEVNTSGFRYGFNSPHPNLEILKRYKELGGKIITLGSDAHCVEDLAYNFDLALALISEAGFKEIAFYHKREPEFTRIRK